MTDSAIVIQKAAVIGAGTMGHGIAQVAAQSGAQVTLIDINQEAVERGRLAIENNLNKGISKGKVSEAQRDETLARITISTELSGCKGADLVVEAAPERIDLKRTIFQEVCKHVASDALLGSNTSSLSITELAATCTHPERFIGTHFFNPPHILKLLELIKAEQTSDTTVEKARAMGAQFGRELVVINDSPGFATSRLGLILGIEAMRMVQEGVGTAEDIDRAMELGYRHPMGPLKLTDLVGLDVRLAIAEYLHKELGEQFRPPPLLRKMVRAGKLGKKSGEGFYRW